MLLRSFIIFLLFPVLSFSQVLQSAEKKYDTISFTKNENGSYYLKKKKYRINVGNDISVYKKRVLGVIEDFPRLYWFAKGNFHRDIIFVEHLIKCYNDYSLNGKPKDIGKDYFREFKIITKKEFKLGPTEELLSKKLPISSKMKSYSVTNVERYTGRITSYSEKFSAKFTYGDSPYYSVGPLLKNLKRAVGDNEAALLNIKKYRRRFWGRTALTTGGGALFVFAIAVAADLQPLGISDDYTPLFAVPGVIVFNLTLWSPKKYKPKYLSKTITAYNNNL